LALLHTFPLPQDFEHAPQLFGSMFSSTHAVPHSDVPPAHMRPHLPAWQK
jgi:hypothetical protein